MAERLDPKEVEKRIQEGHGDVKPRPFISLDYSTYINRRTKARFIDKDYGEWWAQPAEVLGGKCHMKRFTESNKKSAEYFLSLYKGNGGFTLDVSTWDGMKAKARFWDRDGKEYWLIPRNVLARAPKTKHNAKSLDDVKKAVFMVHGDEITIDESTYRGMHTKARFVDKDYGEWWSTPSHIIHSGSKNPKRVGVIRYTAKEINDHLSLTMPESSMVESSYTNVNSIAIFIDKDFGEWTAKPADVMRGHGHIKRGRLKLAKPFALVAEEVASTAPFVTMDESSYTGVVNPCRIYDADFGWYEAKPRHLMDGIGLHPNRIGTSLEAKASLLLGLDRFDKKLHPHFLYRPDFKLTDTTFLDIDGLYWHSHPVVPMWRHYDKRLAYEAEGKRLIQIRQDELYERPQVVKSIVDSAMGKSNVVFARKCTLTKLDPKISSEFFNTNHLMGDFKAPTLALVMKGEIMCALSTRLKGDELYVIRFCNRLGHSVAGGFSKLLSWAIDLHKPKMVTSHVDLRYGSGQSLVKSGFVEVHTTLGWRWTDYKRTYNRLRCRANMDERKLSESEYALELGWCKIYDAGQAKFKLVVSP